MNSSILHALTISGIGLVMLFAALALLYGLMYAMTALIKDREPTPKVEPPAASEADRRRLRVAAIAVGLARAEMELSGRDPAISTTTTAVAANEPSSAWRALHHQRQLTRRLPTRTRRTDG